MAATSDDAEFEDEMKEILKTLGLEHVWPNFKENRVGPKEVDILATDEFQMLGVETIGDRARLKQMCKDVLKGKSLESPVIKKFTELKAKKHSSSTSISRNAKKTRRLYVGWKHMYKAGVFHLVHPAKGGGQQMHDIDKECTLEKLKERLLETYFPNGVCIANGNMRRENVFAKVVSYTGHELPTTVNDQEFTVGLYCDSRKSNPIRIYLQTEKKQSGTRMMDVKFDEDYDDMDDFKAPVTLGTPTITLNRNGRNRLSFPQSQRQRDRNTCIRPYQNSSVIPMQNNESSNNQNPDGSFQSPLQDQGLFNNPNSEPLSQLPVQDEKQSGSTTFIQSLELRTEEQKLPSQLPQSLSSHSSQHSTQTFPLESICCIDDSDSDPDLMAAIKASIEPKLSFEQAFKKWQTGQIQCSADQQVIIVNRANIMDSVKRATRRCGFDWRKAMKVEFPGEQVEDFGGPKREFLSLLMKEIPKAIGENGSFQHSINKIEEKLYFDCGRYITWSLMHGGPSCKLLSKVTVEMLFGNYSNLSISDVNDMESKTCLLKLSEAETDDQIPSDWLIDTGIHPPFTIEKKDVLLQLALKQLMYYRIIAEIEQFKKGLGSFGFLDAVMEYKEEIQSLLCIDNSRITLDRFKSMLQYNFSPEGSNARRTELDTVYAFEVFIQDCCDDVCDITEKQLLAFWTGSSEVPLFGFPKMLEVNFVEGKNHLPVAHTCDMSLELPRGLSPEELEEKTIKAVQWGGQFHLA